MPLKTTWNYVLFIDPHTHALGVCVCVLRIAVSNIEMSASTRKTICFRAFNFYTTTKLLLLLLFFSPLFSTPIVHNESKSPDSDGQLLLFNSASAFMLLVIYWYRYTVGHVLMWIASNHSRFIRIYFYARVYKSIFDYFWFFSSRKICMLLVNTESLWTTVCG